MSIFKESVSSIVFENKHLQVVISKASCKVEKAVYLPEDRDVLASQDVLRFTYENGTFALDNDDVFGDYVILFDNITPENVEETAKLASKYFIDQVDIHHGPHTFIQGDCIPIPAPFRPLPPP